MESTVNKMQICRDVRRVDNESPPLQQQANCSQLNSLTLGQLCVISKRNASTVEQDKQNVQSDREQEREKNVSRKPWPKEGQGQRGKRSSTTKQNNLKAEHDCKMG